jgi:hypothetical protein
VVIARRQKPPELAIRCPWCNAPPGTRCTGRRGRQLPESHPSRTDAHTTRTPAEETAQ